MQHRDLSDRMDVVVAIHHLIVKEPIVVCHQEYGWLFQ